MAEGEVGGAVKTAIEAIKTAADALHLNPEEKTRPGPLVVVGRFYISLTLVLAAVTSAAAVIDWKTYPTPPDISVALLRLTLLVVIGSGLLLGCVLLVVLVGRHPGYLFSPGELSSDIQMQIMGPTSK